MIVRAWVSALFAIGFTTTVGLAQRRPVPRAPSRPAYMAQLASFDASGAITRVTLKDGTRALLLESHTVPVVSLLTVYSSGRDNEPAELAGVSELLQRVILRRASGSFLAKDLQFLGGEVRGSVEYDRTIYEIVVSAPEWKKALELQSKLLLSPEWSDEEFARARDQFLSEMQHRLPNPQQEARDKILALAYPGTHPGSQAPTGLQALSSQQLKDYARKTYTPSQTVLVLCGDVMPSEVLTGLVDFYGKGPRGTPRKPSAAPVKAAAGFQYLQIRTATALPAVYFGYRTAPITSPDYPALEVLKALLGSGESAILNWRLRDEKKVALGTGSELVSNADLGILILHMVVGAEDIDRCEIAAATELEILREQQPEDDEVARARAQLENSYWSGLQTVSARGRELAHWELLGNWKGTGSYLERIRKVDAAEVSRVAQKYLKLEDAVLIECLPAAHEERNLTTDSILATLRDLLKPSTDQELAERERATKPAYDVPAPRGAFKSSEVQYPWRKASILRGPEIYIREDHTQPLIYMGFYYPGGRLSETPSTAGLTALTLRSWLRDTTETSAELLYRQLELYGARLTPVLADDYFGFNLTVASENVEAVLALLTETLKSPKFDDAEIARQREILSARLRLQESDAVNVIQRDFLGQLFRGHAYSLDPEGTIATLSSFTPDTVRGWYAKFVHYRKPVVVVVGDTSGTSLAEFFVKNYSGSRYEDMKLPEDFPQPLTEARVDDRSWDETQSLVLLGYQRPPYGDEDSPVLALLREYVAADGDRFFAGLQARQSQAYSYSATAAAGMRGGSLVVRVAGLPADTNKIVDTLRQDAAQWNSPEIPYRDFRAARNAAVARANIDSQERFAQIRDLALAMLSGRDASTLQERLDKIQEVRPEDLQDAARRFLDREKSVTVIRRGTGAPGAAAPQETPAKP